MEPAHLAERLHGFGTTIFAEMSTLADRTGAINLGQGFPDTDPPAEVAEAAIRAIRDGRNQYPPGTGVAPLREAIAEHSLRWHGLRVDPGTDVLVTTGATEAIAAAMLSLVEPGDEVVMFEPYYDSYAASVAMAGGRRRVVPLVEPDWRFDPDALRAAVTDRTKVLLINSPHNPTGRVLDAAEREAIAEVALRHNLIVVTDEVYEHVAFDAPHVSIATLDGMASRTLRISSGGKTFRCTGWKVGWICGPADLVAAVRTSKQFLTYASGGPLQYGIAAGLGLPDAYFDGLRTDLCAQRDALAAALRAAGLAPLPAEGGYFLTTDVRRLGEDDGRAFCLGLPERFGVVAIPSVVFYDDAGRGRPFVRWAFCKRPELIERAAQLLSPGPVDPGRGYGAAHGHGDAIAG